MTLSNPFGCSSRWVSSTTTVTASPPLVEPGEVCILIFIFIFIFFLLIVFLSLFFLFCFLNSCSSFLSIVFFLFFPLSAVPPSRVARGEVLVLVARTPTGVAWRRSCPSAYDSIIT